MAYRLSKFIIEKHSEKGRALVGMIPEGDFLPVRNALFNVYGLHAKSSAMQNGFVLLYTEKLTKGQLLVTRAFIEGYMEAKNVS